MLVSLLTKFFGSANERMVKKYLKVVEKINQLEPIYEAMSEEELKGQTQLFKDRLAKGETLDDILPEAFATAREASKRILGMRPFDVQLVGGIVLHNGIISEMRTGEGKTLVATLPVYLNALTGKGVHLVTINDYLASRDSSWMGRLYNYLGLSVGCIIHGMSDDQRRMAYNSDVTYGTNHEFGFDYLRDNMKFRFGDMVMRPFNYAIVDEVDSILIDEARTPLIISGSAEDSSELYKTINVLIPKLTPEHYEKDEKQRTVTLTEGGIERIEELLREANIIQSDNLYDIHNISVVHHVNQALKAHILFTRDVDYIVKNDKVIIIDEFTGRMMEGRRYSEGLHQALEAKENVTIEMENQTLASITYQNFFRMYPKLSGMTGTAMTEAHEFEEIYKLHTIDIPTNRPVARKDNDDEVYLTADEKYRAMIAQIKECQKKGQPILVGTTSIEKSEMISKLLQAEKIKHQVLNARYHEQEAAIITDAGAPGAITIATNMAGRGTDIKLGGNLEARIAKEIHGLTDEKDIKKAIERATAEIKALEEQVKAAGGLYVIGTERHESRRIDNQLRGRSGRQGDPGESKFYISLQDDLMRIFGSDRLDTMLRRLGVQEGEAISHAWISKALERAQQKVEARNFDIRKHLLRYDDVMNDQRKIIYEQRRDLMQSNDISEMITDMRSDVIESLVHRHIPHDSLIEQWDIEGLENEVHRVFGITIDAKTWANEEGIADAEIIQRIIDAATTHMKSKEEKYGDVMMRTAETNMVLRILDKCWKDHLLTLDQLRQGINLRAYAQGNPLNEYKREAFVLFQNMLDVLREETVSALAHFEIDVPDPSILSQLLNPDMDFDRLEEQTPAWEDPETVQEAEIVSMKEKPRRPHKTGSKAQDASDNPGRIQRNALCPCGSGKKFKHCHGTIDV
ncbi:preprotein translocase subunit SecA [Candidatus Odyssella acanthamoebae]|uniref:Protein translocase subunit SecA n=1 Tax=Candidatus Odyssella acanthamoebae TaxID=91604 RepID=A0A077AW90_9PROT|nr:preprotein translocase subunit SecA [Candidatus Paracaedibacter acanthamoebae]AIK96671.1 preprotein translocase subunit SecA [Candidatus Paracaedibacter acanthamoebae]